MGSIFVVVRHGETEWSANGRHTSVTDLDLTDNGVVGAKNVSAVLRRVIAPSASVRVVVSPRLRARRTAELALGPSAPDEWAIDDDLAEWSYGELEGLTSKEINERQPGWDLFANGAPGGESLSDVVGRCDRFVSRHDGAADVILAFCHGHLSRVLTARLLGFPGDAARALWNDTATVAVIGQRRDQRILLAWNVRP